MIELYSTVLIISGFLVLSVAYFQECKAHQQTKMALKLAEIKIQLFGGLDKLIVDEYEADNRAMFRRFKAKSAKQK